jgi:hypothetical protein
MTSFLKNSKYLLVIFYMYVHSNVGVGEMVEHSNVGVGEMVNILATLESEKWWIAVGVGEMVEHNHDGGCS